MQCMYNTFSKLSFHSFAWPVQMLTLFMIWWIFYNLSSSRSSTHRNAKNGATTVGGVMSMAIASAAHYRRLRQLSSSAVHTGKFRLSLWMQQCWVLRVPYWGQLCLMLWFLMFFFDVLFRCSFSMFFDATSLTNCVFWYLVLIFNWYIRVIFYSLNVLNLMQATTMSLSHLLPWKYWTTATKHRCTLGLQRRRCGGCTKKDGENDGCAIKYMFVYTGMCHGGMCHEWTGRGHKKNCRFLSLGPGGTKTRNEEDSTSSWSLLAAGSAVAGN